MKTGILLVIISLVLGFIGLLIDGFIGDGSGYLCAAIGFFLPGIFTIGWIANK